MRRNPTNGLPRSERITKSGEIRLLLKSPIRCGVPGAKLFVKRRSGESTGDDRGGEGSGPVRFAVTLPRHYGTAVQRNRSKRLCREAFRLRKSRLSPGHDLVMMLFRSDDHDETFADRDAQLCRLCKKAGIL